MSDRSYARATVYAIADGSEEQVRLVLQEYDFDATFADESSLSDGLVLGQQYTVEELALRESEGLANDLAALGATFEISQESHDNDYAGQVFRYTPSLGMYSAGGAEAGGDPLISADSINEAISATEGRSELVAALAQLTGGPWLAAFETAKKAISALGTPLLV